MEQYDFSGWATRNDVRCSDGRTIRKNAFAEQNGITVPLVWNHQHNDPTNVLGHALLENRDEGVYVYGKFNKTAKGIAAKEQVKNGDINMLSIYANKLTENGGDVTHGAIREVSLVLAAANPAAYIDCVLKHSDGTVDEGIIYSGEYISVDDPDEDILHSDEEINKDNSIENKKTETKEDTEMEHSESGKTIGEIFDTLTEEQKKAVYAIVGSVVEDDDNNDEGDDEMKHNVFDNNDETQENVISHSDMKAIIDDAPRYGSMSASAIAHGITNIDYLFPDAKNVTTTPNMITRDMGWVKKVLNATHHTPFSRIKSMEANLTSDEARAKGYTKGSLKKEEVFGLLRRTTDPQTVYKKQKIDRDDMVDITDFDVVAWLKSEMRLMLDEELARAFLVGDGRTSVSEDKIKEDHIRPIWTDADLYTIHVNVELESGGGEDDKAKKFIRSLIKNRKLYKGSGNPTLFIGEDLLSSCLLLTDNIGRDLYETPEKLANKLRVKEIITAPILDNLTRTVDGVVHTLGAIMVNLQDYNVGADKGGAVSLFDDFDIDYNQQKYLIETRCSGALVKPYSAIALDFIPATVTPNSEPEEEAEPEG
jgi:HK97 family phage prohead protease